jgi:DNA replicative helicase MCM subunit Mcm2 (Cdc46/Mcm family)
MIKNKIGGSIPITVRYLESIIRMSESFARMHIRDFVRQDDIDQAIAVTIKSFISAQKYSVKKTLSKVFDKYITVDRDNFELLLHILSEIEKETIRYMYYRSDSIPEKIELDMEDFEARVCFNFFNLRPVNSASMILNLFMDLSSFAAVLLVTRRIVKLLIHTVNKEFYFWAASKAL